MMPGNSEKGPWIRIALIFVGIFIIVFIVRYLLIKDLDFGFALVIAILLVFIYFIIQRLIHYIRRKEM